ncbi:MAG: BatA domain-containing protein [Bacteroidales bacterium]|jgi:hypothetical protein|nr:BatA domain-containing protein [Bacteroidales bacterium]
MQFVHPFFLIALCTLAIPVIIHLFNFRKYKKIYFTNVSFLQQIHHETKNRSQLKQLLILLARLLAFAALVIAFAQPYISFSSTRKKVTGQRCVSIYIDNSFSMEAIATTGKLIDLARTRALEIASAYTTTDLFQLLTNDFEGRHQRLVNREEFCKLVDEVKLSPVLRTLPEVISRQNDLLLENHNMSRDAYLISDFQKSTMFFTGARPDSSTSWFLVPILAEKHNNLYIDSAWFRSPVHQPGQPVKISIRVKNDANEELEKIPIKLTINKIQKAIGSFSVGSNSTVDIVLPYTENPAGIQYGKIEINDYPIVYDDRYYFSYPLFPSIPLLSIFDKSEDKYLNALFGNDSAFRLTNSQSRQLDYSAISSNTLIISNGLSELASGLVQELIGFARNGGSLVIFPPEKGNIESYRPLFNQLNTRGYSVIDTLPQRVSSINLENEVFTDIFEKNADGKVVLPENVDLPLVFRHYVIPSETQSNLEVLMRLQNNDPFLVYTHLGKGKVYLFSAPLQQKWSNFAQHLIFLPTLYKIALLSNHMEPLSFPVGENNVIELSLDPGSEKNIVKIKKNDSNFEMIPEIRKLASGISLYTHGQISEDGLYSIVSGQKTISGLGFNYDRKESEMKCYSENELENLIIKIPSLDIRLIKLKKNSISQQIQQIRQGTPVWKVFILLTLLFIATEIALLRFLK